MSVICGPAVGAQDERQEPGSWLFPFHVPSQTTPESAIMVQRGMFV